MRVRAPLDITQRVSFLSMVEICRSNRHRVGEGDHQFAHRHGGDQQQCDRDSGGGFARLALGQYQGRAIGESTGAVLQGGQTVVVNNSTIKVDQGSNRMFLFKPGVELEQIVRAVNDVGAAPGDLVAILEALREAGALQAELIVI